MRCALSVFAVVPFALTGGILGPLARGLAFSIPAAVGLFALAGVAVLNGVVMGNEVRAKLASGWPLERAVRDGALHTARAVITIGGRRARLSAHGTRARCRRRSATAVGDRGSQRHRGLDPADHVLIPPGLLQLFLREPRALRAPAGARNDEAHALAE